VALPQGAAPHLSSILVPRHVHDLPQVRPAQRAVQLQDRAAARAGADAGDDSLIRLLACKAAAAGWQPRRSAACSRMGQSPGQGAAQA
jgi:hypothetical protein